MSSRARLSLKYLALGQMAIYKRKSEGLSTDIVCFISTNNLIKLANFGDPHTLTSRSLTPSLYDDTITTDSVGVTGLYLLSSLAGLNPLVITGFTISCSDCNWFAVKSLGSEETLDELEEVRIQAAGTVHVLQPLCPDPPLKAGEYSGLSRQVRLHRLVTWQAGPQDFMIMIVVKTLKENVKLERGRDTRRGKRETFGQGNKPGRNIRCGADHATVAEVEEIGWAGLVPNSKDGGLKNWFSITQSQSQELPAVAAAAAVLHSFDPDLILETADRQVAESRRFWRTSSQCQCALQPEAVLFLQTNQHNQQRSRKLEQKCRYYWLKKTCSFKNRRYM